MSLFTVNELERFIAFNYPAIRNEIAFSGSLSEVAFRVADKLVQGGLVDDAFWARLTAKRPGRAADIARVRAAGSAPPVPVPPPTPQPTFQHLDDVNALVRALLDAGLGSERNIDALLEGIDPGFVAQ